MATETVIPGTAQAVGTHKVKVKLAGQRCCTEADEKGKLCAGHLKRWAYWSDIREQACGDLMREWGKRDVFRCEHCRTLYLPNPDEKAVNWAGVGRTTASFVPSKPEAAENN